MSPENNWLINLRAIATVAVVVLHVAAPILTKYGEVSSMVWSIGNFYDGATRFCVPIFFMISGGLLLGKTYSIKSFLLRRLGRILPPLIFWSIFYTFYKVYFTSSIDLTSFEVLKKIIRDLLNGSQYHLWFVYVLAGLYFFVPILTKWVKNASQLEIKYFLLLWLGTMLYSESEIVTYLPKIELINFSGYLGYMVLGYYLSNLKFERKYLAFLAMVFGTSITIFGTYYLTILNESMYVGFYEYLSFNVLITSIGVFLFFKDKILDNPILIKVASFLNQYSYGIYLSHVLILDIFKLSGFNWETFNPLFGIPIVSVSCLIISGIFISFISKLGGVGKKLSGSSPIEKQNPELEVWLKKNVALFYRRNN